MGTLAVMSPPEDQQDRSQSPAERQVESAPTSHVEDVAETSPHDERVAALLEHSIDVPVLAEAVEQPEAADAADTREAPPEGEAEGAKEQLGIKPQMSWKLKRMKPVGTIETIMGVASRAALYPALKASRGRPVDALRSW